MTTNNTFSNQKRDENNTFSKTNSQDLTEQWKKGELPRGEYYVENNDGVIGTLYNLDNNGWYNIKEVLAPVPSYKEWQQMKAFCEEFNALNVAEENQKLKELLKESRDEIKFMYDTYGKSFPKPFDNSLLTKIDEVLNVSSK